MAISSTSTTPSGTSRPSSSSSSLSVQSHSTQRPPSSLSSRPSSSLSTRNPPSRPSSSASHRPPSSLSTRPVSSVSTRPQSRYSHRPNSRHARSRLVPLCQTLVSQVTGLREDGSAEDADGEDFRTAVEYAVKNLESTTLNKGAVSVDMREVDRQINGLAFKARINMRNALGEALQTSYEQLKSQIASRETDLDQEIKQSRLPDHVQFLLKLAVTPSPQTLAYAEEYLDRLKNPPPPPPTLTWKDILAEEPFEGEHWECVYGMPPASVRSAAGGTRDRDEWDSTPSLSPLNSDDLALDEDDSGVSSLDYDEPRSLPSQVQVPVPGDGVVPQKSHPPHAYAHRREFEELQARQYWRKEWKSDVTVKRKFDIGDPSTLGPAFENALARDKAGFSAQALLQDERYIDEEDMVREVLMALQGRKNIVLEWKSWAYIIHKSTPRLIHMTHTSQVSILSSLGRIATTVQRLRQFTASVFSQSQSQSTTARFYQGTSNRKSSVTRTCEAFADAVDSEIRALDAWCAVREEAMCLASMGVREEPLIVSLLGTEKDLWDAFETSFEVLLDLVKTVFEIADDAPLTAYTGTGRQLPAAVTALLLDTLFSRVQEHLERRDIVTSDALMRVFVRSSEPVWGMIGKWLKDGMGLGVGMGRTGSSARGEELDDEFFIESSGVGIGMMGIGLGDPDFWTEGYCLREGVVHDDEDETVGARRTKRAIPSFLEHVAELVLSAGKSVGLIRALGAPSFADSLGSWSSFASFVRSEANDGESEKQKSGLFSVSVDTLSRLIYEGLQIRCEPIGNLLAKILVEDCALWQHLEALEALFLIRRGDAMSHFIDTVFTKMDAQQPWADFHFLNTAFNDVVESNLSAGSREWVQPSLVRLSYRGVNRDKDKTINRTVKAIDGLLVEYAVPFPLIYIFRPGIMQIYNEIFIFFLQIRRAKNVLERILVRGDGVKSSKEEMKAFYAMRSRLSWFINTLLNFLTTYVVHAQVLKFHDDFKAANSLDEMIKLHDEYLEKIQGRCLLTAKTVALHTAILSILDMCLHFSEAFIAFAGDTTATHDVSRQSIVLKRHRSLRQRRQRRNVIGFSHPPQESEESSDDDGDDDDLNMDPPEPSFSLTSSMGVGEESMHHHVDKISSELDGLVRFIRRGVESLAGGSGEAAATFGVLAFALEDWDI